MLLCAQFKYMKSEFSARRVIPIYVVLRAKLKLRLGEVGVERKIASQE